MVGIAGLILGQLSVDLSHRPIVGSVGHFRTEWRLTNGSLTTEMSSEQTRTVTQVFEDGRYTIHTVSDGTTMKLGGRTVRDDRRTELDLVIGPRGNILQFVNASTIGLPARIAGFNCFIAPTSPLQKGETWSVARAGSADGLAASRLDYTLAKCSKDEAMVEFQFKETTGEGAQGTGTWTIDLAHHEPRRLEIKLTGFNTGLGELVWYRWTKL